MPIYYIPSEKGYQYGNTGKVYLIKDYGKQGAYDKALNQTQAIKASEARRNTARASKRAKGYARRLE